MSPSCTELLRYMCACRPGTGLPLPAGKYTRKHGDLLCRLGFAEWTGMVGVKLYRATAAGQAIMATIDKPKG